jgi:hypothetical protein
MVARGDMRINSAGVILLFLILFLFMGASARGEGLYTRTDELSCGNTLVQAITTCTEDSDEISYAGCTEQHFLFHNRTTGASVRVEASAHPVVHRTSEGKRTGVWIDGIVGDWACLRGKAGSYVVIRHEIVNTGVGYPRYEVFDVNGTRLARDAEIQRYEKDAKKDELIKGFEKKWHSLGLPEPWPWDSFVSIQLFKADRR